MTQLILDRRAEGRERRFYHPELDTLRFFAFLAVFVRHTFPTRARNYPMIPAELARWVAAATDAGAFGVDLFFALSSYLITELLMREVRERGRMDVLAFYARRTLRIWPLYFTFLAFCAFVLPLFAPDQWMGWWHITAYAVFMGNWSTAIIGGPKSPAGILWSVCIEEQFYIAWPILLLVLGVRRIEVMASVLLVLAEVTRFVLIAYGVHDTGIWCNTFTRLDPIACGALLAVALGGRSPNLSGPVRLSLAIGGVFVWVACARYAGRDGPGSVVSLPLAAVASIAILLATLRPSRPGGGLLPYLGKISYGLYVFQNLGLLIAARLVGPGGTVHNFGRIGIAFFATVSLAMISYRWLEHPFLKLKRRFTHVPSRPDTSL